MRTGEIVLLRESPSNWLYNTTKSSLKTYTYKKPYMGFIYTFNDMHTNYMYI